MLKTSFYLLVASLFTACGSINNIGIQTYNPAEITFPKNVRRVLIVNNAVPQPGDVGYQYKLFGTVQDTARAEADSALFDACAALGKSIVDDSFFDDIFLYHGGTREDGKYLIDEKLTSDEVKALCDETGTDAIISIDRLLFEMDRNVVSFPEGFVAGNVDIKMAGVVRSYLPGRDKPLATVYANDSVFWSESADNMEQLKLYLPGPTEALRAAGQYLGTKVTPNFVPHWENETRWYYTGFTSDWKEASAYVTSEKWEEAAMRWRTMYTGSSSWKTRAKAASNLALYCEMETKLSDAYEWAKKSYDLFEKNKGADDRFTQIQKLYMEALLNRLRSENKLKMQIAEE